MKGSEKVKRILRAMAAVAAAAALTLALSVEVPAAKPKIDGKTKPGGSNTPGSGGKGNSGNKGKGGNGNNNGKGKGGSGAKGGGSYRPAPNSPTPLEPAKPEPPKPNKVVRIEAKEGMKDIVVYCCNGVCFTMVGVDGGEYRMGCNSYVDQKPEHRETILPFYISEREVTQALWEAVMGSNPSIHKGDDKPVENVSWHECQEFINKLNDLLKTQFRLPTEAEWEYAARGGKKGKGYKYAGSTNLYDYGWYADNSGSTTHQVATKKPNELGLYDMCGNVFEWTSDLYSEAYNKKRDGGDSGMRRVFRGGSFSTEAMLCQVSMRGHEYSSRRFMNVGLRLAMDAELVKSVYDVYPDGREVLISSEPYKKQCE